MMSAGDLDWLVQFRRSTLSDSGLSSKEIFSDHGDPVWANKRDISDGERWRADTVSAKVTTRFTVERSPFTLDLTPRDELVCEGVTYDITGIKDGSGRRQWLEITAAALVDAEE